ncbi:hypothetical protein ACIQZB_00480 [Streptomyces sp. NPDC097727]|uniref:hypothetical protein n=1 Tax=Streptomyces sp. NPDC097727 TaxID=3366092 RepID=UPI0037F3A5E0
MTARQSQPQGQPQGQEARVTELHRQASKSYATGQKVREGLDRAYARRCEIWGRS